MKSAPPAGTGRNRKALNTVSSKPPSFCSMASSSPLTRETFITADIGESNLPQLHAALSGTSSSGAHALAPALQPKAEASLLNQFEYLIDGMAWQRFSISRARVRQSSLNSARRQLWANSKDAGIIVPVQVGVRRRPV